MQIVDVTDEYKCCCSCRHNMRKHDDEKYAGIYCECDIDEHHIGYVACFESVCERWEDDEDND